MANSAKVEELARQARFVFNGTVKKLKAATLPEIKKADRERTVVVRVDQILQAPPIFTNRTGQDVTVQLKNTSTSAAPAAGTVRVGEATVMALFAGTILTLTC